MEKRVLSAVLRGTLAGLAAATALSLPAQAAAPAQGRRPSDVPAGDTVRVTRVIDAATIEVSLNNTPTLVRYLGVDAPSGKACYAAQAGAVNKALVNGKLVRLVKDATNTDAEGRLLRYVFVLDGRMAGEELIKSGMARAVDGEPDVKYFGELAALEARAIAAKSGGWARCGWQPIGVAPVVDGCTVVQLERLMERRPALPELARVKSGDCVTINKAENPAGTQWSGQYVFRPAGSAITPGTMFVRWKDAFMLITKDADGEIYAHVVRDSYKSRIFPWERGQYDTTPGSTRVNKQIFARDTADNSILVLPDPRTFLFKDLGNGQWQALVDVYEFKSGEFRAPRYTVSGYAE
jgi:endonuclease YncB( thermonuclease family)